MADENELRELAKQRAREKAKQRLSSLNGGDLSRGLGATDTSFVSNAGPKTPNKVLKENISNVSPVQNTNVEVNAKKAKQKTNLGKIVVDKSTIEQMANTQSAGKVRTKRLVIISLCVVIALIWAFVVFTKIIKPQETETNCYMYLSGNASSECTLLLNNEDVDTWIIPDGLSPEAKYEKITLSLDIGGSEDKLYNISFRVEVYNDGKLVENFGEFDTSSQYTKTTSGGKEWYQKTNVKGGQKVVLLSSITFNDIRTTPQLKGISSDNAELKIYVEVNKA